MEVRSSVDPVSMFGNWETIRGGGAFCWRLGLARLDGPLPFVGTGNDG